MYIHIMENWLYMQNKKLDSMTICPVNICVYNHDNDYQQIIFRNMSMICIEYDM